MKRNKLDTPASVGLLVKTERHNQKLTQLQLAGLAGTGIRFVSDLENGKGTVQLQKLLATGSEVAADVFLALCHGDHPP